MREWKRLVLEDKSLYLEQPEEEETNDEDRDFEANNLILDVQDFEEYHVSSHRVQLSGPNSL